MLARADGARAARQWVGEMLPRLRTAGLAITARRPNEKTRRPNSVRGNERRTLGRTGRSARRAVQLAECEAKRNFAKTGQPSGAASWPFRQDRGLSSSSRTPLIMKFRRDVYDSNQGTIARAPRQAPCRRGRKLPARLRAPEENDREGAVRRRRRPALGPPTGTGKRGGSRSSVALGYGVVVSLMLS
jgi:hypothetical protein